MRRTFLITTSVCGASETSTAARRSLCCEGRGTAPSWCGTAASRAATPAPWCKQHSIFLLLLFFTRLLHISLTSLSPPQGGWRGEALRHQQDEHRLRLRRALQPVRLAEGAGAALPAHVAGPAQRLAQRHAGLPRLQPAETVTRPPDIVYTPPSPPLLISLFRHRSASG